MILELLVNDLSISGQFQDIASFRDAIARVMCMREIARQFGRELYCHRNMCHAQVTNTLVMPQAIQHLSQVQKSALMQWITRRSFLPFVLYRVVLGLILIALLSTGTIAPEGA